MARSPTYFLSCKGELTSDTTSKRQLIVILGCTSVGKSAVANLLCNRVDSEIIIADRCSLHSLMYDYFLTHSLICSVQIYRGLDIGSNKPTSDEISNVKVT